MNKTLVAVFACALTLGATALLPGNLSPVGSAYAKGNGNGGGGHAGKGNGAGLDADHAGKATRNHGESGNHYGSERNHDKGRGTVTSEASRSKKGH